MGKQPVKPPPHAAVLYLYSDKTAVCEIQLMILVYVCV